jgi:hypothetical protein
MQATDLCCFSNTKANSFFINWLVIIGNWPIWDQYNKLKESFYKIVVTYPYNSINKFCVDNPNIGMFLPQFSPWPVAPQSFLDYEIYPYLLMAGILVASYSMSVKKSYQKWVTKISAVFSCVATFEYFLIQSPTIGFMSRRLTTQFVAIVSRYYFVFDWYFGFSIVKSGIFSSGNIYNWLLNTFCYAVKVTVVFALRFMKIVREDDNGGITISGDKPSAESKKGNDKNQNSDSDSSSNSV